MPSLTLIVKEYPTGTTIRLLAILFVDAVSQWDSIVFQRQLFCLRIDSRKARRDFDNLYSP